MMTKEEAVMQEEMSSNLEHHELVGQVGLDRLGINFVTMTEEEEVLQEEMPSNLEHHSNDSKNVETEGFGRDHNETQHETQAEDLNESNTEKKTTVQMKEESQDPQGQAGSADLSDSAQGQKMEDKVEQDAENTYKADIQSDECSSAEKDRNQAQPQEKHDEDSGIMSPQKKEEAAEGHSTTCCESAIKTEDDKELQQRTLNIEESVENDILRHILLLDKDEDICKELPKADQGRTIKTEQGAMSDYGDNTLHKLPGEGGSIAMACSPKLEVDPESKRNHTHSDNEHFKEERHLLTLPPSCVQPKISHNSSLQSVSLINHKEGHVHIQKHSEEMTDPYGEMPVLENEYLKDHPTPLGRCKEEEDEMVSDSGDGCKDQEHEEDDKISAHKSKNWSQ